MTSTSISLLVTHKPCGFFFENELINVVDEINPMTPFVFNQTVNSAKIPCKINKKLRKRILKAIKKLTNQSTKRPN